MHPLGVAVWVKLTNSEYLMTADFSLFLPRTCHWNLSVIENHKFDLRSFHRAELRPLTEAIRCPPNCEYSATYIIYLLHTAVFTILEQGVTRTKTIPSSTLNYPTTVGNKQLFTSSQLHAWITKPAHKKLPHIEIKAVASAY